MAPLLSLCPSLSSLVFYLFIRKYLYNAISWMLEWNQGKKSNYTHIWNRKYLKCSESKGIIGMSNKYFLEEGEFFFISEKEVNFWKKTERLKKSILPLCWNILFEYRSFHFIYKTTTQGYWILHEKELWINHICYFSR